jgi:uncharacterized membrane protein
MSRNRKRYTKSERRKIEKMQKKRRNQKMIMGLSIVILLIVGFIYVVSLGNNNDEIKQKDSVLDPNLISNTLIRIPVSSIDSEADFYSFNSDGVDVKYFAVMGTDGQVHVAFDACDVCYYNKKGYRQIDNVMRCINCGNEYPINSLGTENTAGGCWPSYIPIVIEENDVMLKISDIEDKSWMF